MKKLSLATTSLALIAALGAGQAHAISTNVDSHRDYRMKTVVYDPTDTVKANVVLGLQVHIVVGKGEHYETHAFGDNGAWSFAHFNNNFFVRPTADLSDTNLTIVTNKHTYEILLHFIGKYPVKQKDGTTKMHYIKNPWSMRQATVELRYRYPQQEAEHAKAERDKLAVEKAEENASKNADYNINYWVGSNTNSTKIRPLNVWDDYHFTYFKFEPGEELPTLFVRSSDGKESTVNTRVIGPNHNIIQAETTAHEWYLRYGKKRVVGVMNEGYNPERKVNPSGTRLQGIQRVVKHQEDDDQ